MIPTPLQIETHSRLEDIGKAPWQPLESPDFPFADFEYLHALEHSGSVSEDSGWTPLYLAAQRGGEIQGACYLYTKAHSYGEYIFDWSWAAAYEKQGLPYYPKLLSAVPFTPATGPKLLFRAGADRPGVAEGLIGEALRRAQEHSSLHWLFLTPEELPYFEKAGFILRHSYQYHWFNEGYGTFEDFLAALQPRKRKQIVRERAQLAETGLAIHAVTGDALTAGHAQLFYTYYLSTIAKRGAYPYLTESFFRQVFETLRHQIVLFLAEDRGKPVGGALCYFKGKTLYGRYWGARQEVRNLHFELCYYRPLEWALARGLTGFEAGAQGEHKISRGFIPTLTHSAHWIAHPEFRQAIARFVEQEKIRIRQEMGQLQEHSPYRPKNRN